MELVTAICLALVATAGLLCVVRLVRPGPLEDRVVALDALLVVVVTGVGVGLFRSGDPATFDVLVVTSLLGFVGTITAGRYLERRQT